MAQHANEVARVARRHKALSRDERERAYMNGEIEVVAIPRAWIRDHGFPDCYDDAVALTADVGSGAQLLHRTRQALMQESWQRGAPERAYLREGDGGQAFLFVQAWAGAA